MWASVRECHPSIPRCSGWVHVSVVSDAVERQVEAYDAHDLDAFVACYAETVVIEDAEGRVLMSGRDAMRDRYGKLFGTLPDLRADIPRESALVRTWSTRSA